MRTFFLFFLVACTPEEVDEPIEDPLPTGVFALDGEEFDRSPSDLVPIAQNLTDVEIVGVGESVHFSNAYHTLRARVMRQLIEEEGFRSVALEGFWQDAEHVRTYLETCQDLTPAMSPGLTFAVWFSDSSADFLQWLCAFNEDHPEDPVSFFSVDVQEPWRDMQWLMREGVDTTGLQRCIGGGLEPDQDPMTDPATAAILQGQGSVAPEDTEACLEGIEILQAGENPFWVDVALTSLAAGQQTFSNFADWDPRDEGMAALLLAQREHFAPGSRTIYWAHNAHIVEHGEELTDSVYPLGWKDAGSHLGDALGDRYAAIGLVAHKVITNWLGQPERDYKSDEDSLERRLRKLSHDLLYVDTEAATGAGGLFEPDEALSVGHPGTARGVPARHYRGLMFARESPEMVYWTP